MNRGARIIAAISDRMNPVVIKELRQAVQSRLVIAILLLFLLVNVFIVCWYLLVTVEAQMNERAGQDLFSTLFVVLVGTCMIFVPLYAATRLTMERNDSNIDLLFITTIAPAAIIRGKFWAALALTALIYSAAMPFLTFTYLLRGVDLPSIFFALGVAFLLNAASIMLAIFVGSVAGGLLLRFVLAGGLLFLGGLTMVGAIEFGTEIVRRGLSSQLDRGERWAALGFALLLGIGAWGLLYLLSVAGVSARSSNRMLPIRVFLTVFWLIVGGICLTWSLIDKSNEPVIAWSITSVASLSVILCFTLGERETWTSRVRRHIPRSLPLRLLAWPFYTGSAGGMIWCCALSAATLVVGYPMAELHPSIYGSAPTHELQTVFCLLLFAWCYSMSGLFVRRIVAPKSAPLVGTAIAMGLLGIAGTLPMLIAFLLHGPDWRFETLPVGYVMTNPFVLARRGPFDLDVVITFLVIWALLALLVNLPWFFRQWEAFRPYVPKRVRPAVPVAEEPPVVHV